MQINKIAKDVKINRELLDRVYDERKETTVKFQNNQDRWNIQIKLNWVIAVIFVLYWIILFCMFILLK